MGRVNSKKYVDVSKYPFIQDILWDLNIETIEEQRLFNLVEVRWGHIKGRELTESEKIFIAYLVKSYGNGVLLTS